MPRSWKYSGDRLQRREYRSAEDKARAPGSEKRNQYGDEFSAKLRENYLWVFEAKNAATDAYNEAWRSSKSETNAALVRIAQEYKGGQAEQSAPNQPALTDQAAAPDGADGNPKQRPAPNGADAGAGGADSAQQDSGNAPEQQISQADPNQQLTPNGAEPGAGGDDPGQQDTAGTGNSGAPGSSSAESGGTSRKSFDDAYADHLKKEPKNDPFAHENWKQKKFDLLEEAMIGKKVDQGDPEKVGEIFGTAVSKDDKERAEKTLDEFQPRGFDDNPDGVLAKIVNWADKTIETSDGAWFGVLVSEGTWFDKLQVGAFIAVVKSTEAVATSVNELAGLIDDIANLNNEERLQALKNTLSPEMLEVLSERGLTKLKKLLNADSFESPTGTDAGVRG